MKLTKFGKVIASSLFMIAMILGASDTGSFKAFMISKLVALVLMYIDYKILKKANIME